MPTWRDSTPVRLGSAELADFFYLISLQPLDVQECKVSLLKNLIHICLEIRAQGHDMTFKVCNLDSK